MVNTPLNNRAIHWNGLQLSIPASWDTIVREKCHLIFEQELRPVLELRWEPKKNNRSSRKDGERILARLQHESDRTLSLVKPPRDLGRLKVCYDLQFFRYNQSGPPDGVLLSCRSCGTLFLAKFYPDSFNFNSGAVASSLLNSIDCQHLETTARPWAIHDISFTVPGGLSLKSYAFNLGMSSLSFTGRTDSLHLCRLAPAAEHLKHHRLTELFGSFCNADDDHQEQIDACTLQYSKSPGLLRRIVSMVSRRKVFRAARFNHLPENDRILGFLLESSRPIKQDRLLRIQENYGIIQEDKAGSDDHP